MNATTSMDYGTLNWVKAEIDETLKQARHTLEAFAANSKDSAQIRFCANHLHQVRGTLQMIELYGPALIAEEMELLANGLLNDEIAQRDSACELLMRAILQLPDYLERLQTGHSDNPLVLLPLLNDLRATRGQNLLSEGALFAPDLSVTKAARLEISSSAAPDIRAVARKLRPAYQLGLVNWHRNQRAVEPIKQLAKVLNRLEESSSADALVQLWWVAGGVLEALRDGSLQASVAIELLMGQIDRQIKRLIDVGEQAWVANPPRELVTNLLYYVSRAQPAGARVSELRQAFHLTELLPGEAQTDQEEQALTTPNLEL
ncbi:MAG TPA: Hpt domain-containing protein, partial [Gammaproteobacteria bacterium]|nr:Hpt domain-containing protein [Gammaproteobacteria bacterium]